MHRVAGVSDFPDAFEIFIPEEYSVGMSGHEPGSGAAVAQKFGSARVLRLSPGR
jgi:hypothetical protein